MAAKSTLEKYPTRFDVVKVSDSLLGNELTLFFLAGVVTKEQNEELGKATDILSEQEIDAGRVVVSTLLNRKRLEELNKYFDPLSKSWRGQYYSLAHAVVDACEGALKN